MKDMLVSVALTAALLAGLILNSAYVSASADALTAAAEEDVYEFRTLWESKKATISVSVDQSLLILIDSAIDSAVSFYESGSMDEYRNAISLACRQIKQLKAMETFSADAVI